MKTKNGKFNVFCVFGCHFNERILHIVLVFCVFLLINDNKLFLATETKKVIIAIQDY